MHELCLYKIGPDKSDQKCKLPKKNYFNAIEISLLLLVVRILFHNAMQLIQLSHQSKVPLFGLLPRRHKYALVFVIIRRGPENERF